MDQGMHSGNLRPEGGGERPSGDVSLSESLLRKKHGPLKEGESIDTYTNVNGEKIYYIKVTKRRGGYLKGRGRIKRRTRR